MFFWAASFWNNILKYATTYFFRSDTAMRISRKFENLIYWSASVNSFGNWCTVLGLALLVQQKHGGTALAFALIAQSFPNHCPIIAHDRFFAQSRRAI